MLIKFQHLRKTGGTSINAMFRQALGQESVCSMDVMLMRSATLSDAQEAAASYRFVSGHCYLNEWPPPSTFSFVMLRNPLARLHSERRQWRDTSDHDIEHARSQDYRDALSRFRPRSLTDILAEAFVYPMSLAQFWNHQALTLGAWRLLEGTGRQTDAAADYLITNFHKRFPGGGVELERWLANNREVILESAVESLGKFDYVGFFEDFAEAIEHVFREVAVPRPPTLLHLNDRTPDHDESHALADDVIDEFLGLDMALYEEASRQSGRGRYSVPRGGGSPRLVEYPDRFPVEYPADRLTLISGWHAASLREDGRVARWSQPESAFQLFLDSGHYEITLKIFGSAHPQGLDSLVIFHADEKLVSQLHHDGSQFLVTARFRQGAKGAATFLIRTLPSDHRFGVQVGSVVVDQTREGPVGVPPGSRPVRGA